MIQLTPTKRKSFEKMIVILDEMSARSTKMIELVDSMIDQRKKEHNDKITWLLSRGEKLPPHVKLLT